MSEGVRSRDYMELDLRKLLMAFLKNIWLIGICAAIGFVSVAAYLGGIYPDQYTASATMYVYTNNPNQTNYQYASSSDLNTATRLMETYMVVIKSNKVMEAVSERLGPGYSTGFIAGSIRVGSVSDTEVMRVYVTTSDPQLSMDICNAVADCAPAEIIRVVNAGSVEVIDYATLPLYPDAKNLFSKSLIGAFFGAALVMGIILIMVMGDKSISTEEDLTSNYDIPLLATFPDLSRRFFSLYGKYGRYGKYAYMGKYLSAQARKKSDKGDREEGADYTEGNPRFIITEKTSPAIVEIYKLLRTNLSFAMTGCSNNAVIVTSAIPSEGKSTVSANLAIVAAQDNRHVLLIDADMRKPKQSDQFVMRHTKSGLSSVLMDIDSFDDTVQRNLRPGLDVLTSGMVPPNPSELLNSDTMRELLARLRARYDLIVIDTPPVNVVADSLVLSKEVAGAIMVVRHRVSNSRELNAALGSLEFTGMKVLGFVLTDMSRRGSGYYYRRYKYYQKYNTGYYSVEGQRRTSRRKGANV